MTDIVERLRAEGALAGHYEAPAIQREAADEIERLRAALAHYACPADCNECNGDHTPMWCGAHARAALGEDRP